jgi:surface protein
MDLYLNLMPDLRNIVFEYFGDVIFSQGDEVGFATAEEFRKSKAIDCIFINYEITSTDHTNKPDIPKTLLRCSGVPKIKTYTLAFMFADSPFNGDLSKWDVSAVTNMDTVFISSQFNGDISQWDVSSVANMYGMFCNSRFKGDLSQWDVSSVTNMRHMFSESQFNGDISRWDVSNVINMAWMFIDSPFNGDLSQWNVCPGIYVCNMLARTYVRKKTAQSWSNFKNHGSLF